MMPILAKSLCLNIKKNICTMDSSPFKCTMDFVTHYQGRYGRYHNLDEKLRKNQKISIKSLPNILFDSIYFISCNYQFRYYHTLPFYFNPVRDRRPSPIICEDRIFNSSIAQPLKSK